MLSRLVDSLMPHVAGEQERVLRSRFLIQVWVVGFVFGIATLAVWGAMRFWGQFTISAVMTTAGVFILWFHARTGRVELASHVSLAFIAVNFSAGVVAQTPADPTNAAFLVVLPLLAGFQFGPRAAFPWMLVALVSGVGALQVASAGYTLPYRDEAPLFSQSVNLAFLFAVAWVVSARFHAIRREAYERARSADQAKSMFLATISHEIRTPMNGVLGMTEVMLSEAKGEKERAQLEIIQRSGRLLVSLINDLLDLTKLEANKLRVDETDFDLDTVLDDVEALAAAAAREKSLTVKRELGADVPRRLRGDGLRLRQVLGNLVGNAVKFTMSGSVTIVVTREPGEALRVRFEVRDTGIGIPADRLAKLFAPFEQGDARTTRRFGGTGLGLALSQQLVTMLGGRIEADSRPGEGSRFFFTLPFKAPLTWVSGRSSPDVTPVGDFKTRVLVVDDNVVNLAIAAALVKKAGYAVQQASSGQEAVDIAARGECALVLMDCHMPEMDGFQATERIRALGGLSGTVPIIALTASTTQEDLDACRRAGMNECLTKPVTLKALSAMLQRFAPNGAPITPAGP